ncbi:hypothetical protein [Roseofilum casamattae]|uniref:Uncharacterized protein n=1 Tax=Roseofilum casamattae BLCC-M143 TaxID=3022442 RepID=A0ABT7BR82_9CYAN|nr:hypothetical protein [Roseofilum casamattae]MDJ1181708.1 hypothetical protein [Roseofilum casamattae BLCC-M143]
MPEELAVQERERADRAEAVIDEKDQKIQQLQERLAQMGINPDTST